MARLLWSRTDGVWSPNYVVAQDEHQTLHLMHASRPTRVALCDAEVTAVFEMFGHRSIGGLPCPQCLKLSGHPNGKKDR